MVLVSSSLSHGVAHALDPNIIQNLCDYCEQQGKWKEIPFSLHLSFLFSPLQTQFVFSLVFPAHPYCGICKFVAKWEVDAGSSKEKRQRSRPAAVCTYLADTPPWLVPLSAPSCNVLYLCLGFENSYLKPSLLAYWIQFYRDSGVI